MSEKEHPLDSPLESHPTELHSSPGLPPGTVLGTSDPPPFTFRSLWGPAVLNPLNHKSFTLPILNLRSAYARNFHLSWLGFMVAFLSWFAFPPLFPEAIKDDLKLTKDQIANSNIAGLASTLGFRLLAGPLVDRYGPRKVMAIVLILGAIPSGLAGTVSSATGLYIVRIFIGILGATFVPCQAWTTTFFDKNIVGRANALVGGWGNLGGGITFVIMVSLYDALRKDGLSQHVAWRAAFAIVPVPILLTTAALTFIFGTDHPAGKWNQRHTLPATALSIAHGHKAVIDHDEEVVLKTLSVKDDKEGGDVQVDVAATTNEKLYTSELDVAVNERLTWKTAFEILTNSLTWLPALAYITTFGFELAVDASLSGILFNIYKSPTFGQTKAGYLTALYGLLNLWTRPTGGYIGDLVYPRFGVPGKKYNMLACGFLQGAMAIALGLYIDHAIKNKEKPSLAVIIVLMVLLAIFNEAGCGANFSLVPHCNPYSNGMMSGIVGSMGNLGGIIFAMVFRFQSTPLGKPFWICGIICMKSAIPPPFCQKRQLPGNCQRVLGRTRQKYNLAD